MMSIISTYRESIATRLLLHMTMVSVVTFAAVGLALQLMLSAGLESEVAKRADTILHSLQSTLQIMGNDTDLPRMVNALSAAQDVHQIVVTQGEPPIIIAANDGSMIGQKIESSALTRDAQDDILRAYSEWESYPHFHDKTHHYEVTLPLNIKSQDLTRIEPGVIHLSMDSKEVRAQIRNNIKRILFILFIAVAAMLGLLFLVTRKQVLNPILAIRATMQARADGDKIVLAPIHMEDEVGKVAETLNSLLKAQEEAENTLREKTEEAEAANRMKSEFLANMSHEIRTPMNGVIGMTSLLLEGELASEQRQRVEVIRQSGEALLEIINDILDISKIEAGKMTLEPIPFNLQHALVEMTDLLAHRCRDKGLDLILRYAPKTPEWVTCDPGRLRQILLNLASNAIKFTDTGHVLINVEAVETNAENTELRFEVIDTGIGIPEAAQKKLFQKFTQADGSTTRKYGGTGLGLSICRRLVEMMGGKIGMKSEEKKGSTFFFTLLLPFADEEGGPESVYDARGERVLVADGNSVNCHVIQEYAEAAGMRCDIVTSGGEALVALKTACESGNPYALALLDRKLPGLDAVVIARAIKDDVALKQTLLILITGSGQRGEAKDMEASGFAGYLVKPFHSRILTDAISLLLAARREGKTLPLVTRHTVSHSVLLEKTTQENIALGAHILVAEDNRINQMMVTQMLEMMDCKVDIAGNGKEAVEMIRQIDYDLVLMDCMMPEMSGYEATETIRRLKEDKRSIIVIALTANALQGDRQKCLAAGMNDYLSKPVKKQELQAMLTKWLKEKITEPEIIAEPVQKVTAEESYDLVNVMDQQVFNTFLELVGSNAADILHKHCDIAQGYLRAIKAALDAKDFKAMADSAHPLKSSSQQIGAHDVAQLAARMEEMGRSSSPNDLVLQDMALQLEQRQQRVKRAISQTFALRKTA